MKNIKYLKNVWSMNSFNFVHFLVFFNFIYKNKLIVSLLPRDTLLYQYFFNFSNILCKVKTFIIISKYFPKT